MMDKSNMTTQLDGEIIELQANQSFPLNDENNLYWLQEGAIDLFCVDYNSLINGHGKKTFIIAVHPGEVLVPFPFKLGTDKSTVIATAVKSSVVRRISFDQFEMMTRNDELSHTLTLKISAWTGEISKLFRMKLPATASGYLPLNETYIGDSNEKLVFPKDVDLHKEQLIWLYVSDSVSLMGMPTLELDQNSPPFPLTPFIWLQSNSKSKIRTLFHPHWIQDKTCIEGLLLFNRYALHTMITHQQGEALQEQTDLASESIFQKEELREAFLEMQSLISRNNVQGIQRLNNRLDVVYGAIGEKMSQNFNIPAQGVPEDIEMQVDAIAKNSWIYYRKIQLPSEWWNSDNGPILGVYRRTKQLLPVALLPESWEGYQIVGLNGREKTSLNALKASHIQRTGYVFYRHFPSSLNNEKILSFALEGKKFEVWTSILSSALIVLTTLFYPIALGILFDYILVDSDLSYLWQLVAGLSVAAIGGMLFIFAREKALLRLETKAFNDIEFAVWQRVLDLPLTFFKQFSIGDLLQRLDGIKDMHRALSGYAVRVLMDSFFSFLLLMVMFYYSPALTIAIIILMGCMLGLFFAGVRRFSRSSGLNASYEGALHGKVVQSIMGISKLRTNGAENRIFANWAKLFMKIKKIEIDQGTQLTYLSLLMKLFAPISFLVITAILFSMIGTLNEGIPLSIGAFISFAVAFAALTASFLDFQNLLLLLASLWPRWERNLAVLQAPLEARAGFDTERIGELSGAVRIEHLYFRYEPTSPYIHEDISINIHPGELIGIIGHSGCGKSSLARLLLGFETPDKGAIYYNGRDLRELDIKEIRTQIGVVLQSSMIMTGTIRENVTGGRKFTDEEVMQALRMASFESDLAEMPMGLRTPLISGGKTLAGGQRQRLILARALIGNPKILILDEATNALDNVTQAAVIRTLETFHITRIVIAHRLSTIQNAHQLYVLDKGKIVQKGTYAELLKEGGLFSEFVASQQLY